MQKAVMIDMTEEGTVKRVKHAPEACCLTISYAAGGR